MNALRIILWENNQKNFNRDAVGTAIDDCCFDYVKEFFISETYSCMMYPFIN